MEQPLLTTTTTRRGSRRALALVAAALVAAGAGLGMVEVVGSDDGGGIASVSVRADLPVTSNDLRSTRAQNSPLILADPTDARFVVVANRLDAPQFSCALHVSGDGGRSWLDAKPVPKLPPGAEKCYGPEVAFDNDGKIYYLFVGLAGTGNSPMGIFLTTSSDRARTFSPPRRVLGAGNYQVRMTLDPDLGEQGRLHLVWLQTTKPAVLGGLPSPPNPIVAIHSNDGGATFSKPVQVSDPERPLSVAPAIAVGEDHSLHVVYYDLGNDERDYYGLEGPTWDGGNWSVVHSLSKDAGATFSKGVAVDDDLAPPERVMLIFTMAPPALVADGAGRVYTAWYDSRRGDWDVFLRASSDGGGTWGPLRRLNDDSPGHHQYLPRLSLAPDGRLDAVFYDRRDDPRNRNNNVYYTFSSDGAQRFSPNRKVTRHSSDPGAGQTYLVPSAKGLVDIGSRIGLFSLRSTTLAAWTDTRNAGDSTQQDVYATVMDLPAEARQYNIMLPGILVGLGIVTWAGAVVSGRRSRLAKTTAGEGAQPVGGADEEPA